MPMTITYTFAPLQIIFASRFNQNFSDVKSWADTHELLNSSVHGITGSFVDTGTTGQVITAAKRADKFARNVPFESSNARLSLSAGRLKLVGLDGNDPSVTNPVTFVIPSTTSGLSQVVTFTTTTNCTIDDATTADSYFRAGSGTPWGTSTGVAWGSAMPFALYVATDGTTPVLFLSRLWYLTQIPSAGEIGYKNNPPASGAYSNVFACSATDVTTTHASQPCWLIGSVRMTKDTNDDWVIQTLQTSSAFLTGAQDGIGTYRNFEGALFVMPTGQFSAPAGSFFLVTAGIPPTYTDFNFVNYRFKRNGEISMLVRLTNTIGGTAGAGANALRMTIPLPMTATDVKLPGYMRITNNATFVFLHLDTIAFVDNDAGASSGNTVTFLYQSAIATAISTITGANQNNAVRGITGSFSYFSF